MSGSSRGARSCAAGSPPRSPRAAEEPGVAGSAARALEGQAAIVTGAGRGIGRAIALSLAAEGAKVSLIARTRTELEAVAGEVAAAGGQAAILPTDVSVASQVADAIQAAEQRHGPTDILINNAGVVA